MERDKRYGQRHVIQIPKSCVQCCFILSFVVLLLSGFVVYHVMAEDEEVDLGQSISMFDIGKKKRANFGYANFGFIQYKLYCRNILEIKSYNLGTPFLIKVSEYDINDQKIYEYRESEDYKELVTDFNQGSTSYFD